MTTDRETAGSGRQRFSMLAILGLALVSGWGSAGCRRKPERPDEFTLTGHLAVEPTAFLRLRTGMTQRGTIDLLGTAGRHAFTYRKDGSTYLLTIYYVRTGPQWQSGIHFYGLFKDDSLLKVLRSPRKNVERNPYKGTTASRPKTRRVDDESRIAEILSLPGDSREELARVIDRYSQPRPQSWPQIPPKIVDSLMADTGYAARVRNGYERNRELLRQFDGHRIKIGMSKVEVNALLGEPAHSESITPTLSLSIYAKKIYGVPLEERLEINPFYRFSPIAVVFEENETTRVYSRGFISRGWMPNGAEFGL